MGVSKRRTCFAAVVDDGLCVANVRRIGVVDQATLERLHDIAGVAIVELLDTAGVVAGVHEDLVNSAGFGHDMNRADVTNGKWLAAIESRILVRKNPHFPVAAFADRFQGRG